MARHGSWLLGRQVWSRSVDPWCEAMGCVGKDYGGYGDCCCGLVVGWGHGDGENDLGEFLEEV